MTSRSSHTFLVLAALCSAVTATLAASPVGAPLLQDFESSTTVNYTLSQLVNPPAASVQSAGAGSSGRFLRLLTDGINDNVNAIAFNQTALGLFGTIQAEFDFRIGSVDAPADGFAFMLIPTSVYGTSGPGYTTAIAFEEPNISDVFAIGFDVHPRTEPRNDIAVHWNGVERANITMPDANLNLTSGNFHHAKITLTHLSGGARVTVTLTPNINGTPSPAYTPITNLFVPGLYPFDCRVEFAGRTGGLNMSVDLDNINVQFTDRLNFVPCVNPPANLVSWWRGDAERIAHDCVGNNDGALQGRSYSGQPGGIVGPAFSFDGVGSGFVTIPFSSTFDFAPSSQFTLEAWVNGQPQNQFQALVVKSPLSGAWDWGLYVDAANHFMAGLNSQHLVTSATVLQSDRWYHVAVSYDNGAWRLYVNGVLEAQASGTSITQSGGDLALGRKGAADSNYFSGLLDEVSLYNRALSVAEIQATFNAGGFGKCLPACAPLPTGAVSWWAAENNGNDGFGANSGTLQNGLSFALGEVGQAFNFTAADQGVLIPASSGLDVGRSSGMTVEAWVNPTDVANEYPIAEWGDNSGLGAHLWVNVAFGGVGGQGSVYASLRFGDSSYFASPPGVILANVWQHVALTYDQASGIARLYHNGVEVASKNIGGIPPQTASDLNLGHRVGGPSFRGRMDEVTLYKRALSLLELQAIYNAGFAGKCRILPFTSPRSHSLDAMAIVNYTGMVIDADRANNDPAYNRESILVDSLLRVSNPSSTLTNYSYVLRHDLRDGRGEAVPLVDSNGQTNSFYFLTNTAVFNSSGSVRLFSRASLRPAARLSPDLYQVGLRILSGGTLTDQDAREPRHFYHFTNTASGDAAINIIAAVTNVTYGNTYLVETIPGQDAFTVNVQGVLVRYDDFAAPPNATNITISLDCELRDEVTGEPVTLVTNRVTLTASLPSYLTGLPSIPAAAVFSTPLSLKPTVQLDNVNHTYHPFVRFHVEYSGGATISDQTNAAFSPVRFLQFNGKLFFGALETRFESLSAAPLQTDISPPNFQNCSLPVAIGGGYLIANSARRYGDGTALQVRLLTNGTAEYTGVAPVPVRAPVPDDEFIANICFRRTNVMLSPSGANGTVTLKLPAGFGFSDSPSNRLLQTTIEFGTRALNQSLAPSDQFLRFNQSSTIYCAEETKPFWIPATSLDWRVDQGEIAVNATGPLVYVRDYEVRTLNLAGPYLEDQTMVLYPKSNERYYFFVNSTLGTPAVRADANGSALLSMIAHFGAGSFNPHFPTIEVSGAITWQEGVSVITNDVFDTAQSALSGNWTPIELSYARDCTNLICRDSSEPDVLRFTPAGDRFRLTADGGLVAEGSISSKPLTWGHIDGNGDNARFAQRTSAFSDSAFHMPGHFLRGDQTALSANDRPAALLLTGFGKPGELTYRERPGDPEYRIGDANYAGLNFRVGVEGAKQGQSILANVPVGPYPLTGRSKYYARPSGITGIHESAAGAFHAPLYGYDITFSNYKLSYLDGINRESRTDGSIYLPEPSDFRQEFAELKFSCQGELESAAIPSTSGDKTLAYWNASIKPLSLDFLRGPSPGNCRVGRGFLVLGVETRVANVKELLHGQLGFKANGNLTTAKENADPSSDVYKTGADSRFKLPSKLSLAGPSASSYNLDPASEAYLNNWEAPGRPAQGFVSFAGRIALPFFEDMRVHVHTSANTNQTNLIYLMGGWPAADSQGGDQWWRDGNGQDFFNNQLFDAAHHGFPDGVPSDTYRRNNGGEKFHPRAQKSWLDVVDFDYPLNWSSVTRTFSSFNEKNTELLVLKVKNHLKNLTPSRAEIDFGAELGLPKFSLANIAFDSIEGTTGAGAALASAIGTAGDATQIISGLNELKKLLNAQPQEIFRPAFDAWINPYVDAFYANLSQAYAANPNNYAGFRSSVGTILHNTTAPASTDTLLARLRTLDSAGGTGSGVFQQATGSLHRAIMGVDQLIVILGTSGGRPLVRSLIRSLIGHETPQFVGALAETALSGLVAQADPTFEEILARLRVVRSQLNSANTGLAAEFSRIAAENLSLFQDVTNKVVFPIQSYFDRSGAQVGDFFNQRTPAEVKTALRRQIEEQFFGSPIPAKYQVVLKNRVYDTDSLLRESVDSLFQQANQIIRDGLSSALAGLDNTIDGFLGDLGQSIGAGRVSGYAEINGDSLSELRLDAHLQLKVPDDLEFNGYLRILELSSENTPAGCRPGSGPATEVTFGAPDVPLTWLSPNLHAGIGGKVTLEGRNPVGVGGWFNMNGPLSFEAFTITKMGATLAFGKFENYLGATARAKVNRQEYAVGIFFGRTCTVDPLLLVDPDVAQVLPQNYPLTGAYVYGEAWFPLNEVLGIPSTCLLTIRVGAGLGAFYFKTGQDGPATYGGKFLQGMSGEILCIVSVQGEVRGVGVKYGDTLTLRGIGNLNGELGVCPFCVDFSKSITVTIRARSGDVDTDIDF